MDSKPFRSREKSSAGEGVMRTSEIRNFWERERHRSFEFIWNSGSPCLSNQNHGAPGRMRSPPQSLPLWGNGGEAPLEKFGERVEGVPFPFLYLF
ncbi:hypothetical protein CDAR_380331 [Caerostris darwini]|uniref:Uncharacterized protein n=1 Tax=Caerostris darwini TaxID=1538125 RepID=A0AAV4THW6_9ARAC|nr:hypothetical protein CDAR_380331 [Caerostris darwini]